LSATARARRRCVLGLPQDFFEDVMPEVLGLFAQQRPNSHVEVRAGRNYALEEEVQAGRLDVALAFFKGGFIDGRCACRDAATGLAGG
jgi:DNA-binding transcriptional LysR family regulator